MYRRAALLLVCSTEGCFVVRLRGPGLHPFAGNIGRAFRRFPHIHAEGDAGASQKRAEPPKLVLGEGVHGVDEDCYDARRHPLVAEAQATADGGIEKALGLSRPSSGGYKGGPAGDDRANGPFLVTP